MRLATPAMGTISLSLKEEPELFSLARVGLGALGVVTQVWILGVTDALGVDNNPRACPPKVTLQCVPRHQLLETTFTATVAEVKKNHVQ